LLDKTFIFPNKLQRQKSKARGQPEAESFWDRKGRTGFSWSGSFGCWKKCSEGGGGVGVYAAVCVSVCLSVCLVTFSVNFTVPLCFCSWSGPKSRNSKIKHCKLVDEKPGLQCECACVCVCVWMRKTLSFALKRGEIVSMRIRTRWKVGYLHMPRNNMLILHVFNWGKQVHMLTIQMEDCVRLS